jgi:hypothetical protein
MEVTSSLSAPDLRYDSGAGPRRSGAEEEEIQAPARSWQVERSRETGSLHYRTLKRLWRTKRYHLFTQRELELMLLSNSRRGQSQALVVAA